MNMGIFVLLGVTTMVLGAVGAVGAVIAHRSGAGKLERHDADAPAAPQHGDARLSLEHSGSYRRGRTDLHTALVPTAGGEGDA